MSDDNATPTDELKTIFGIDLGTTYSCIAYVDDTGRVVVVPNSDSERITPSVVFFKQDGTPEVGRIAKELSETQPDRVAMLFKPFMGDPDAIPFSVDDKSFAPEELSNFVLRKLVADAEQQTRKKIEDVVITCPAWFGDQQRAATKTAGEIAGLNVRKILNEPTAAAISYGMESATNETVLVYDLGGGTFDVTMIDIQENVIRVVCTGGDHTLGGRNWDDAIVRFLLQQAAAEMEDSDGMTEDRELLQDLRLRAEKAKQTLGRVDRTRVPVSYQGNKVNVELTRDRFNELTEDLLESTITLTHGMLEDARKKREAAGDDNPDRGFNKILLVGGSTKMPQVQERLEREFTVPCEAFDQDEAVARGAAIFGHKIAIEDEIKHEEDIILQEKGQDASKDEPISEEVQESARNEAQDRVKSKFRLPQTTVTDTKVTDVASHSFGVACEDMQGNPLVMNIIKRNTDLPATVVSGDFQLTFDGQNAIDIRLMENNSDDDCCTVDESVEMAMSTLTGLPNGLPASTPVEVAFKLNDDGILEVTAECVGKKLEIEVKTTGTMTAEEVDAAKQRSNSLMVKAPSS